MSLVTVAVVPARLVYKITEGTPLNFPKPQPGGKRIGYNRKGYSDGYYNISVRHFFVDCRARPIVHESPVEHEGREFHVFAHQIPL